MKPLKMAHQLRAMRESPDVVKLVVLLVLRFAIEVGDHVLVLDKCVDTSGGTENRTPSAPFRCEYLHAILS